MEIARLLQQLRSEKGMGRSLCLCLLVMPLLVEKSRRSSLEAIRRCEDARTGVQMSQIGKVPLGVGR